jgi:hypothetical protein
MSPKMGYPSNSGSDWAARGDPKPPATRPEAPQAARVRPTRFLGPGVVREEHATARDAST